MASSRVIVVGAGVFGLTTALELARRRHRVVVFEQGTVPNPLAASTDISKVIRMEYGPDDTYMALGEAARAGWLAWNDRWRAAGTDPLYHETGVLMLSREQMAPGGFEYESWRRLLDRGHEPERMDREKLVTRFPAWSPGVYEDGFYHAKGGYAESGRVVEAIEGWARRAGVTVEPQTRIAALLEKGERVVGVRDADGKEHMADDVVASCGAWTPKIVDPERCVVRATGHPVFHLLPPDPSLFHPSRFPVFTADTSRTGYYGFPVHRDGVVKIANHGLGAPIEAAEPRAISGEDIRRLRAFLKGTFPSLLDAEIVYTRLCLYTDTQDEDFWIDRDPERAGLVVASGGSGHGFKFAPVLGSLIADAVEGVENSLLEKFRWRPEVRLDRGLEAARCHE